MSTQPSNNGTVTSRLEASEADMHTWLEEIKTRHGDDGRLVLNEKQYDMAFLIATQVCKDIRARAIQTIIRIGVHCVGACTEDLALVNSMSLK